MYSWRLRFRSAFQPHIRSSPLQSRGSHSLPSHHPEGTSRQHNRCKNWRPPGSQLVCTYEIRRLNPAKGVKISRCKLGRRFVQFRAFSPANQKFRPQRAKQTCLPLPQPCSHNRVLGFHCPSQERHPPDLRTFGTSPPKGPSPSQEIVRWICAYFEDPLVLTFPPTHWCAGMFV